MRFGPAQPAQPLWRSPRPSRSSSRPPLRVVLVAVGLVLLFVHEAIQSGDAAVANDPHAGVDGDLGLAWSAFALVVVLSCVRSGAGLALARAGALLASVAILSSELRAHPLVGDARWFDSCTVRVPFVTASLVAIAQVASELVRMVLAFVARRARPRIPRAQARRR